MEILILKNGEIFARASAEEGSLSSDYEMVIMEEVPAYPTERPEKGKTWELVYNEGVLSWELKDRPLTTEERVEELEAKLMATEILLGVEE